MIETTWIPSDLCLLIHSMVLFTLWCVAKMLALIVVCCRKSCPSYILPNKNSAISSQFC